MKRLFLDVQDHVLESWLLEKLRTDVIPSDEEKAEVAVLTTESERYEERCKMLTEAGCTVFVLAPEILGTLSSKLSRMKVKGISYSSRSDSISVLTRLAEASIDPPIPEKKEVIAIYSAKQAGGSFVAWNLWATLVKLGKKVSLCSVSDETSPFHVWIPGAPVYFGGHEGREEDDIWIVDASGSTTPIEAEVDLAIVVHDEDPSKPIIDIDVEKIANRISPGEGTPDLFIPDLGRLAVYGMHSHQAVVELNDGVFRLFVGLWGRWRGEVIDLGVAGKDETTSVSDEAGEVGRLPTLPVEDELPPVAPSDLRGSEHKDSQQEEKTGFSFDDEVPPTGTTTVGGSDIGFQFDE